MYQFSDVPVVFWVYCGIGLLTIVAGLLSNRQGKVVKGKVYRTFAQQVRFYSTFNYAKGNLPWQTGFNQPMAEAQRLADLYRGSRWAAYENMLDFAIEHDLLDKWAVASEGYNEVHEMRESMTRRAKHFEQRTMLALNRQ